MPRAPGRAVQARAGKVSVDLGEPPMELVELAIMDPVGATTDLAAVAMGPAEPAMDLAATMGPVEPVMDPAGLAMDLAEATMDPAGLAMDPAVLEAWDRAARETTEFSAPPKSLA